MDAAVKVVPRAEYESFLAARKSAPPEQVGKEIFESVCLVCHKLDERFIGPPLRGNPVLADAQALETTVRNGFGRMPAVGHDWTDEQIWEASFEVSAFAFFNRMADVYGLRYEPDRG